MNPKERIVLGFLILSLGIGVGISLYNKKRIKEATLVSQPLKVEKENTPLVNINTALEDELVSLPGIGPTIASRIIEYRNTHGPFKKKRDLLKIKGIGKRKFEELKDKITIGD